MSETEVETERQAALHAVFNPGSENDHWRFYDLAQVLQGLYDLMYLSALGEEIYGRRPQRLKSEDPEALAGRTARSIHAKSVSLNSPLEVVLVVNAGVGAVSLAAMNAVRFYRKVQAARRDKAVTDLYVETIHMLRTETLRPEDLTNAPERYDELRSAAQTLLRLDKLDIVE